MKTERACASAPGARDLWSKKSMQAMTRTTFSRRIAACCALVTALVLLVGGCSPTVGDSCAKNTDCGRGLVCDLSMPSGYCTLTPCQPNGCPDESVCVDFGNRQTWCMRWCDDDGHCRDGYKCIHDKGPTPFCGVP